MGAPSMAGDNNELPSAVLVQRCQDILDKPHGSAKGEGDGPWDILGRRVKTVPYGRGDKSVHPLRDSIRDELWLKGIRAQRQMRAMSFRRTNGQEDRPAPF